MGEGGENFNLSNLEFQIQEIAFCDQSPCESGENRIKNDP